MNFNTLNYIDYIIIAIIAVSTLISLVRGFVREAFSLVSWVLAFWVALTFTSSFANYLQPYISHSTLRNGTAFISLFLVTLILGALVNWLIASLVDKTGLSGTDRLLGILFGFCRGALLVALLLLFARLTPLPQSKAWQQAKLVPFCIPVEQWLRGFLPEDIESLQG